MGGNKRKWWWERRHRRVKPAFLLSALAIGIVLAVLFPYGFIMLLVGAFLALLGLYFFCFWR